MTFEPGSLDSDSHAREHGGAHDAGAGKRVHTEKFYGAPKRNESLLGPVQLRGNDDVSYRDDLALDLSGSGVAAAAQHGLSAPGEALPHGDAIQRSFGAHDVGGVTAHVGGAAREASDAMGANGYATGNDVAFASSPSLFLAAHEATHVVQQRAGVQLSTGVGEAGDAYEQQADAVATRVVAGESAADLLGAAPSAAGQGGAVQRSAVQLDKKAKASKEEAAKDKRNQHEAEQIGAESFFLDVFAGYTKFHWFRDVSHGGKGPPKTDAGDAHLNGLAERVRGALVMYGSDKVPDHLGKALELWGPARAEIDKMIQRHQKLDLDVKAAKAGFENMDSYLIDGAATSAIKEGADKIDFAFKPDAAYHQAEYAAARNALIETKHMVAMAKEKQLPNVDGAQDPHFAAYASVVETHEKLAEAQSAAAHHGLAGAAEKGAGAAGFIRQILQVSKATIQAVSLLASVAWPLAKEEGKQLFASFAKRIATHVDLGSQAGEFLGKAIAIAQIAKGVFELIEGIASGNSDKAITGARTALMGGVSLLMQGTGAGLGATLIAPALVYIWVETIRACLDVGGLLREVPHMLEVQTVGNFVDRAGKLGRTGAEAFAALNERYAAHTYTKDAEMQKHVQVQIEEHMKMEAQKLAEAVHTQLYPSLIKKDDRYSLGHYPDAVRMMGPAAVGALMEFGAKGKDSDPGTVAFNALTIFSGIAQMGAWVHSAHGHQRDAAENKNRRGKMESKVDAEWKHERDKREDLSPQGPTDAELEESMQ